MENKLRFMKTKILNWRNKNALEKATQIIINGGILVYPTDTIYGFGVDASNIDAINKLNTLKNRKGPISVIAPNKKVVSNWINIPDNEKAFALQSLSPYKTIIFPVINNVVNDLILGENNSLGIRIPDHSFCNLLANKCNIPITTTSVNRSGEVPKKNCKEIFDSFQDDVDLIIEDGELNGSASSIYVYQHKKMKKIR